jgi:CRP-like cAMP-binding protein/serine/threonine protein phosphatase PrpC
MNAYKRAFEVTNQEMHRQSKFDDMMSGTTAICVMVKDGQLHISNVGDSRAIIASKDPKTGRLVGEHLSMDQTPYRKDERERCKRHGARVCTMSQLEGLEPMHENWGLNLGEQIDDEGDPPRLFRKDERYPGVAFTRSFGDFVADQIGVCGTPEQSTVDLHSGHKFMVIASDGVFEFITTQQCVDMVKQYEHPLDACRAVVSQAYNLWLQYEVRTDDITMICVRFTGTDSLGDRRVTNGAPQPSSFGQRPVRRDLSKAKRSAIMAAAVSSHEEENFNVEEHIVPKSVADITRIEQATKTNFLFAHLTPRQRDNVFKVMSRVEVRKGDVIIKQGDKGDRFYVVDKGNYEVLVYDAESQSHVCVHEYHENSGTTNSFGELALMYNKPRAATVRALSAGVLWALDRLAFRCILLKTPSRDLIRTLRGVDVLSSLSYTQVQRLTDLLSEVSYNDGDKIITQGDSGDTFYVIASGSVNIFVDGNYVGQRVKNEYFGERALLKPDPRAADCVANGKTRCLVVSRLPFEEVLGPLQEIIDHDRQQKEARAQAEAYAQRTQRDMGEIRLDNMRFDHLVKDDDTSSMHSVTLPNLSHPASLLSVAKGSFASATDFEALIEKRKLAVSLKLHKMISPCLATFASANHVHMVLDCELVCQLSACMDVPFDERTARFYGASSVLILHHLHHDGVICRGITSDWLFLQRSGYLCIADFRLSKRLSDNAERTYTMCGNPEYLAPEQISGAGHSTAADLWSLGILIFEMMAGRTPFSSADPNENDLSIFNRVMAYNGRSLTSEMTSMSRQCQDLIGKLLQPVDRNRISAMDEKLADLYHHPWFAMDGGIEWLAMHEAKAQAPLAERCDAAARRSEQVSPPHSTRSKTVPESVFKSW